MSTTSQTRAPAVAGLFFPGDPARLRAEVRAFLQDGARTLSERRGPEPRAILVPHAGYVYSGPTAGVAFAAVSKAPRRVILVGPAHRLHFRGISAGDYAAYETPLGPVTVDQAGITELCARGLATSIHAAHVQEHCLEVMMPFILERFGPDTLIVPLLVGAASAEQVEAALDHLLGEDDLLLISSDLSHFHPYDDARQRDLATLDAIAAGRWDRLDGEDACGYKGLSGAMRLAAARGWQTEILDYRNSGDTAGDRSRVVGYGAARFA